MQPLAPDDDGRATDAAEPGNAISGADTSAQEKNVAHAWAACRGARASCHLAQSRANTYWDPLGQAQACLLSYLERADAAAVAARVARSQVAAAAARLGAASQLVDQCERTAAGMTLA